MKQSYEYDHIYACNVFTVHTANSIIWFNRLINYRINVNKNSNDIIISVVKLLPSPSLYSSVTFLTSIKILLFLISSYSY